MAKQVQPTIFAGIDWGSKSHQVCVLSSKGAVLGERAFPHSGEGLHQMLDWILARAACDATHIAVAIEIPHGPVVDSLLDRDFQVFSINPKQLDRFRDRFSPAGAKDDRRDARVLASAIRTDPDCLRALEPLAPVYIRLREWSRMTEDLTVQRTKLTHRFRELLWRYYPQFLELGRPLHTAWMIALWNLAPTPARARRIRRTSVDKLLKKHRIRRLSAEQVLGILRSEPMRVAPGVTEAVIPQIQFLAQQLILNEEQIQRAKCEMEAIMETLSASEDTTSPDEDARIETEAVPAETEVHCSADEKTAPKPSRKLHDIEILSSLPGVGNVVLATLLSEASGLLRARDYRALRCLCGVAPVTRRSGKSLRVVRRRACQTRLVNAVYHWSRVAIMHDPVSKAKYRSLRARGHTHGRALRSVADRLLSIACAMLRDGTRFDPSRANVATALQST